MTPLEHAQAIQQWALQNMTTGNYAAHEIMGLASEIVQMLGKRTDEQQSDFIDSLRGEQ